MNYKLPKGCYVKKDRLICPPAKKEIVPIQKQIQQGIVMPISEAVYVPKSASRLKLIVGVISFIVTTTLVYVLIA